MLDTLKNGNIPQPDTIFNGCQQHYYGFKNLISSCIVEIIYFKPTFQTDHIQMTYLNFRFKTQIFSRNYSMIVNFLTFDIKFSCQTNQVVELRSSISNQQYKDDFSDFPCKTQIFPRTYRMITSFLTFDPKCSYFQILSNQKRVF